MKIKDRIKKYTLTQLFVISLKVSIVVNLLALAIGYLLSQE